MTMLGGHPSDWQQPSQQGRRWLPHIIQRPYWAGEPNLTSCRSGRVAQEVRAKSHPVWNWARPSRTKGRVGLVMCLLLLFTPSWRHGSSSHSLKPKLTSLFFIYTTLPGVLSAKELYTLFEYYLYTLCYT